jgi:hypothetical protein
MQFLLAFAFSWFFAGNVLAVIFSSAGPCYYGYFHSPDPYAAQLAYLKSAGPSWAVSSVFVQGALWDSYTATRGANIGISAMPSMHVVVATLLAILGPETQQMAGTSTDRFRSRHRSGLGPPGVALRRGLDCWDRSRLPFLVERWCLAPMAGRRTTAGVAACYSRRRQALHRQTRLTVAAVPQR